MVAMIFSPTVCHLMYSNANIVQSAKIQLVPPKCSFLVPSKKCYFSNIETAILDFSLLILIKLSHFQLCPTSLLPYLLAVDWFMASFLYCSPYRFSNCRSFRLFKALAKSNGNLFAIASKCDNYSDSWKSDKCIREQSRKEAKN